MPRDSGGCRAVRAVWPGYGDVQSRHHNSEKERSAPSFEEDEFWRTDERSTATYFEDEL